MAQGLNFDFDREADVLYVSLGRPRRAISREVGDDVLVRFDLKTNRVVGFTILNFGKWFAHHKRGRIVPVSGDLALSRR